MKELQEYMKQFHEEMGWQIKGNTYSETKQSLLMNYMLLTTEVGEIAEELRKAFNETNHMINDGEDEEESFTIVKESIRDNMGKEIADCMAYLTKMANYLEIDMEDSFYQKMNEIKKRKNKDVGVLE